MESRRDRPRLKHVAVFSDAAETAGEDGVEGEDASVQLEMERRREKMS